MINSRLNKRGAASEPDEPASQPTDTPVSPGESNTAKAKRQSDIKNVISTIAILILAPLIAIFLSAFVFQSYRVDGSSMETTLQNNDWLIVWKLPRTWSRITGHQYVPKRGDVVIFVGGQQLVPFGQDASKQLVKRVVALPGESVEVKNGQLLVFNKQHPNGFDPDKTLAYGKVIGDTEPMNTNGIIKLGPNQIFVCGDNRPGSLDSRSFGPVQLNSVVGQLVLRFLPLDKTKAF